MVLHGYSPRTDYKEFMEKNARSILGKATNNGISPPGSSWSIASTKGNAATTSSALDAVNAYLRSLTLKE